MRAAILLLLGVCAWAQTAPKATYKAPRLADGHPDLQGIWTNATVTPLERPAELAGKAFFANLAEATAFEKRINEANNADRQDQDQFARDNKTGVVAHELRESLSHNRFTVFQSVCVRVVRLATCWRDRNNHRLGAGRSRRHTDN